MKPAHKHKFACIILAAGVGTRMRSALPKVMHKLAGKPMINHVLATIAPLAPEKNIVVVAPHMDSVRESVLAAFPGAAFAVQDKQQGTGHAVRCAESTLAGYAGTVLVLYGDTPMIRTVTLDALLAAHTKNNVVISLLGMRPLPPTGYGRLVMRESPFVDRIVECRDATPEEKKIEYVWAGVMAFDAAFLHKALAELAPSPVTGEYYLTSLIEAASEQGLKTLMVPVDVEEAMGVNDRTQQAEAEKMLQQRLRTKAMEEGATLVDPQSVYLCVDTKIGRDVVIYPHVVFGANVTVEDGAEIRSFSYIEGAHIGKNAIVGPFARLRPGTVLGEGAMVGNFVELKKTTLGRNAKASHLSYIGDAEVGAGANIGAGTITCNYDGANKHQTVIGEQAFIGSNTSLVAPVNIGAGAIVGAGSVITEDVAADALAIARAEQVNIAGKAKALRTRGKK